MQHVRRISAERANSLQPPAQLRAAATIKVTIHPVRAHHHVPDELHTGRLRQPVSVNHLHQGVIHWREWCSEIRPIEAFFCAPIHVILPQQLQLSDAHATQGTLTSLSFEAQHIASFQRLRFFPLVVRTLRSAAIASEQRLRATSLRIAEQITHLLTSDRDAREPKQDRSNVWNRVHIQSRVEAIDAERSVELKPR